jgi:hypothetical protein|tara:strand:- start:3271 stop:4149 length:879 start_codon:yes stop_codon:yes gene_type:complete
MENIMSVELTVAADRGKSLAELMGVSETSSKQSGPSIARVNVVSSAIKGEIDVGGKKIKTDVIPVGSYKITMGDDVVYAESISVRIVAQRQQWQRWNSTTNEMEKSVMGNTVNGDMQDSVGGFNLGRPSGYIEDFNALPEATKDIMRSVKRVKLFMGLLTINEPMDETGAAISTKYDNLAFVMDVKNRDSMKSLEGALAILGRRNLLPIMSTLILTGKEESIPTGATYGVITAAVGEQVELSATDNDTLTDFLGFIEYSNGKIMDLHHERSNRSMSTEDAELVGSIIDVDAD